VTEDRYESIEAIGTGGMATVWRAYDRILGRPVAIKRLLPHLASDPSAAVRFKREAQAAASLSHPGIVKVFDTGEDDEGPFIVLELVEGKTLADRLSEGGAFHPPTVVSIVQRIAESLDHAHSEGIVHCDIKPSNLILDHSGGIRLTDFGIAKTVEDPTTLTSTGDLFGTIAYMAPEILEGQPATPASDIYSLGAVTHEMLSGRPPFQADSVGALLTAIRNGAFSPLTDIAGGVAATVARALSTDPAKRPDSAGAFAAGLVANTTLPLHDLLIAASTPGPIAKSQSDDPTLVMAGARSEPEKHNRFSRRWALAAISIGAVALVLAFTFDGLEPEATGMTPVGVAAASTTTTKDSTTTTSTSPTTIADTPETMATAIETALAGLRPPDFKPKDVRKVEEALAVVMKKWSDGDMEDIVKKFEDLFDAMTEFPNSPEREEITEMVTRLAELMGLDVREESESD
jgi:serine/threonine-protein kinase